MDEPPAAVLSVLLLYSYYIVWSNLYQKAQSLGYIYIYILWCSCKYKNYINDQLDSQNVYLNLPHIEIEISSPSDSSVFLCINVVKIELEGKSSVLEVWNNIIIIIHH